MSTLAVKQIEESSVRVVRRRRKQSVFGKPWFRYVVLGGVLIGLMLYVGLYAKITKNGYQKARLAAELRQAKTENQYLRAELRMLSCPDRLAEAAFAGGMVAGKDVRYVGLPGPISVAKVGSDER